MAFYAPLDTLRGTVVAPVSAVNPAPFINPAVRAHLTQMTREEANLLPYGAIKVDDEGTIEIYNTWESQLAGFDSQNAEGSSFFTEIASDDQGRAIGAPCGIFHLPHSYGTQAAGRSRRWRSRLWTQPAGNGSAQA